MLGTAQRSDGAGDGRVQVGARSGDDAGGERGGVEFVFGVEDQRLIEGVDVLRLGFPAVQELQEVRGDRRVVRLDLDAPAAAA